MRESWRDDSRLPEAQAMALRDLVDRLEIPGLIRAGHELVGPCPNCGGRDRFAVNLRDNVFNCRKCGGKGGAISLVMFVRGCEFRAALDWMCGPATGLTPEERAAREEQARANRARNDARAARERELALRQARAIWAEGRPATGTPVQDYLALRGIDPAAYPVLPASLRYHADLALMARRDSEWVELHRGPAMLAAIQGPEGRFQGLHRTWFDLDRPRGKLQVVDPVTGAPVKSKLSLGSVKGGAIRLTRAAPVLVMGEGIETTLSALLADTPPGAAYWAGVSLGNMAGQRQLGPGLKFAGLPALDDSRAFVPPEGVQRLIYVQDGDSDPRLTRAMLQAGLRRAMALRPGLRGQIVHAGAGVDLNDVLLGRAPHPKGEEPPK